MVLDETTAADRAESDRAQTALAVAQERVRCLEEQVAFLQEQLELEQRRSAELLENLKAELEDERRGPKLRLW